jgi:hypothetical protein
MNINVVNIMTDKIPPKYEIKDKIPEDEIESELPSKDLIDKYEK